MNGNNFLNLGRDKYNHKRKNKNTYMDVFLERRNQLVDFALKRNNKSAHKYNKPSYYINEPEEILINNIKKENNNRYDESYNRIKSNLLLEEKSMENNTVAKLEDDRYDNKINKTKEKNKENKGYISGLKIDRIITDNYFNKDNLTSPMVQKNKKYIMGKNKFQLNSEKIKNRKEYKYKKRNIKNKIYRINNINKNKLNYCEGEENHRFYDSSGINDYLYSYESYKIKKYYKTNNKGLSKSYVIKNKNNESNLDNNRISNISPIKQEIEIDYEDNKEDFKSIEKELENQNFNNKNRSSNIKERDKIKLNSYSCKKKKKNLFSDDNNKNRKNSDDMKNLYSIKIIKEEPNNKVISIIHKSTNIIRNEKNKIKDGHKYNIIEVINDETVLINNNNISKNKFKDEYNINLYKNNIYKNTDIMLDNKINMMNLNNNMKNIYNIKDKEEKELFYKQNKKNITKNKVNNIKDKLNILKNNKENNIENINYNNIDILCNKIKENKGKNNKEFNQYYDMLFQNDNSENKIKNDFIKKIKNGDIIKNKIIQNSSKINNKRKKYILDKQILKLEGNKINKINYIDSNFSKYNIKKELIKTYNNKNKLDYNNDISFLFDKNEEKIKLLDEKEYERFKLKNKRIRSTRGNNEIRNKFKNIYTNDITFKRKVDFNHYYARNYEPLNSPRSIWFYINNKIMPPNEI